MAEVSQCSQIQAYYFTLGIYLLRPPIQGCRGYDASSQATKYLKNRPQHFSFQAFHKREQMASETILTAANGLECVRYCRSLWELLGGYWGAEAKRTWHNAATSKSSPYNINVWRSFKIQAAPWSPTFLVVRARIFDCAGKLLHIACGSGADSTRDTWTKQVTSYAPRGNVLLWKWVP